MASTGDVPKNTPRQFGLQGAQLLIAGMNPARLEHAKKELAGHASRVAIFECDVTNRNQVEALADFAWSKFKQVDKYAAIVMKQIKAGEFYIMSHAYNFVRISARWREVEAAFRKYAPRYEGDIEFDVRTLGVKNGWYPRYPDASENLPV
ncbi:SDR family NAD(P)-dependent oxidoreductase [Caballeronia sp. LZ034LL]|uniref:SDR family NAD(P)-dependent oxidoreductase n=1 Tax=Caballeronia sp. LZ034LL TaxID=3038567 RepID=UPI002864CA1D|nr:SDR family NAD(P)-dependent oxidoreductase [Caballeronia sp. LZ034LL]MDR5837303.1 SDR family oxidoreductase [Caballeronia sp. LZ034LL]